MVRHFGCVVKTWMMFCLLSELVDAKLLAQGVSCGNVDDDDDDDDDTCE